MDTFAWGVLWCYEDKIDGHVEHLMERGRVPLLFPTREEARTWIKKHAHGYLRWRKDLRAEPFGWRMPRPVRVEVRVVKRPLERRT